MPVSGDDLAPLLEDVDDIDAEAEQIYADALPEVAHHRAPGVRPSLHRVQPIGGLPRGPLIRLVRETRSPGSVQLQLVSSSRPAGLPDTCAA